jgi:hypothetical protein
VVKEVRRQQKIVTVSHAGKKVTGHAVLLHTGSRSLLLKESAAAGDYNNNNNNNLLPRPYLVTIGKE